MFSTFKKHLYKIPVSRDLTLEDLNIILQRGFLVKKNFTIQDFLTLTAKLVIYVAFISFVSIGIISMIYIFIVTFKNFAMIGIVLIGLYFIFKGILWYLYDYLRSGITFYNIRGTIDFGEISFFGFRNNPNKGMLLLEETFKKIISPTNTGFKNYTFVAILIFVIFYLIFLWGLYICFGFLTWIFLLFFSRIIFQSLHPLYAFGNLGSKIQSLTPLIEKKSKEIQKNFQEDMNFSVLSDGFDALASTFSEIISLVIKLEKIEAKANRGNIFDSEKYIKSLRSDILDPLKQLKSFLEKQREELMKSQKELERVRVGGADLSLRSRGQTTIGGQEQKELASKRSESLLIELTENIEKLDTMIQKIA